MSLLPTHDLTRSVSRSSDQEGRRPLHPLHGRLWQVHCWSRPLADRRAPWRRLRLVAVSLMAAGPMLAVAKPSAERAPMPAGELLIARTVMADAAPSSFAVGFPNGLSFCYDPVRGGLSYAWRGGFADLTPTWPEVGKFVKPAKLQGQIVYREAGPAPLRRGDPSRAPEIIFKGYRLEGAAIEFRYTIDGVMIREQVSAPPDGDRIVRRFQIEAGDTDSRWWYVPGAVAGAPLAAPGGVRDGGGYRFDPAGNRVFTLEILMTEGGR